MGPAAPRYACAPPGAALLLPTPSSPGPSEHGTSEAEERMTGLASAAAVVTATAGVRARVERIDWAVQQRGQGTLAGGNGEKG